METHAVDRDEPVMDVAMGTGDGVKAPTGEPLSDLLDALVDEWVKMAASEALEVNQHTMAVCHDSRQVSRRMRRAA